MREIQMTESEKYVKQAKEDLNPFLIIVLRIPGMSQMYIQY